MTIYQENTADLALAQGETERQKFAIGQRLLFVAHSPDESIQTGVLTPGDVVRPVFRNGCGMGIDVERVSDGAVDMLWPEEVTVLDDNAGAG